MPDHSSARHAPPGTHGYCQWFLLCENPANATVTHPVLGEVPTCERCAVKLDLKFTTSPSDLIAEHRGVKP